MNLWKRTNVNLATSLDWNANHVVERDKGDGKLIRRYARRKLKQELRKEQKESE